MTDSSSVAFGFYVCRTCGEEFKRYLSQVRRAGKDPLYCSKACMHPIRDVRIEGEIAYVPLGGTDLEAQIDAADVDLVAGYNWQQLKAKNQRVYAQTYTSEGRVTMHRVIMGYPEGMSVDHADNDGLNNRRANLRVATNGQNELNKRKRRQAGMTSKYKGVYKPTGYPKWRVRVACEHGGVFDDEREAALAYDRLALARYGEFALTNQALYPDDF